MVRHGDTWMVAMLSVLSSQVTNVFYGRRCVRGRAGFEAARRASWTWPPVPSRPGRLLLLAFSRNEPPGGHAAVEQ